MGHDVSRSTFTNVVGREKLPNLLSGLTAPGVVRNSTRHPNGAVVVGSECDMVHAEQIDRIADGPDNSFGTGVADGRVPIADTSQPTH